MALGDIDVCRRCDEVVKEHQRYYGGRIGWQPVWLHGDGRNRCWAPDAEPSNNPHLARAYLLFVEEDPRHDPGYWDELSPEDKQEYLRRTKEAS